MTDAAEKCPHGDPTCPCPDGLACHYEGRDRMRSPIEQLCDVLREAGARPTIDPDRSTALPCVLCRTTEQPRELVKIGTYCRPMGGGLQPGDAIVRPMCARCRALTEPAAIAPAQVTRAIYPEQPCDECDPSFGCFNGSVACSKGFRHG